MDIKNKSITSRDEDFAQWYTDVCKKAELMDYSEVKGFIIYRPYGYAIWEQIQNYLNKLGYCYTTRVYKEIGKYKVGQLYISPWGDVLKIDEVKTYWKVSDRPFYDEMNDDEKIEICKYSEDIGLPYEFIKFSKV